MLRPRELNDALPSRGVGVRPASVRISDELARRAGERAGVPAEKVVVEGGPHALRGGASMGPVMPLSREASDGAPVA